MQSGGRSITGTTTTQLVCSKPTACSRGIPARQGARGSDDERPGNDGARGIAGTPTIPIRRRRADALALRRGELPRAGLNVGEHCDRYQVVVHVEAETLRIRRPTGANSNTPLIARRDRASTCLRRRPDSNRRERAGEPLDVGRKTRTIRRRSARLKLAIPVLLPGCTYRAISTPTNRALVRRWRD